MPTYIRFGDDHYIAVQEEFAEVRQRIEESESSQVPLFEATRVDGTRMLLNANEIRTISEGKKKDGGGKS
ncbi:MAG TPA: hypothetical protein VHU86_01775 [Solirubrobacterales bacterium]|jgi:uncharacterized protein YlzI (FlbEa/FlbD family)|nr:hypothetical protein [Solirubrobacterales bacterium]